MYGSVKQTMEVVITSALTFLVATTVHAKLGTIQMEPLAEVSYMLSVPKFPEGFVPQSRKDHKLSHIYSLSCGPLTL